MYLCKVYTHDNFIFKIGNCIICNDNKYSIMHKILHNNMHVKIKKNSQYPNQVWFN